MILSVANFQNFLHSPRYNKIFAQTFTDYLTISRPKFNELKKSHPNVTEALDEFKKRVDNKTFAKTKSGINCASFYCSKVFPCYDLILDELIKDEWIASTCPQNNFHRDHILHQPMTAYIVAELLDSKELSSLKLLEDAAKMLRNDPTCEYIRQYLPKNSLLTKKSKEIDEVYKDIIRESAIMAAMYHDIGYPLHLLETLKDKLKIHSDAIIPLNDVAKSLMDRFYHRLLFRPFDGYTHLEDPKKCKWDESFLNLLQTALAETHGVHSALNFLNLNEILSVSPDRHETNPLGNFCIEFAAKAILMHDMCGLYHKNAENQHLRINFKTSPLSFIVTLADQIQGFGRTNLIISKNNETNVALKPEEKCDYVELKFHNSELNISYNYKNKIDYTLNNDKFIPKQQTEYFDQQNGYLNCKGSKIDKITAKAINNA